MCECVCVRPGYLWTLSRVWLYLAESNLNFKFCTELNLSSGMISLERFAVCVTAYSTGLSLRNLLGTFCGCFDSDSLLVGDKTFMCARLALLEFYWILVDKWEFLTVKR